MLNYLDTGPADGPALVLAHALGTNLHLWDWLLPLLPAELRIVRFDLPGHGRSPRPAGPYSMGSLVKDAETLLGTLNVRDCVFCGIGLGGMVAQGLAVKRLDQIRALVLSGTAAKVGQPAMWQQRIETAQTDGMATLADALIPRWFARKDQNSNPAETFRTMMSRQSASGYAGCCAAISGTDFYTPTSGLRLPFLAIAGSEDRVTPPDLVKETANLVPGSKFHLIRRAGHLPCLDQPQEFAQTLTAFLREIGHDSA